MAETSGYRTWHFGCTSGEHDEKEVIVTRNLLIAGVFAVVSMAGVARVSAGWVSHYQVGVGLSSASGALGSARNSADNHQYIGCHIYTGYEPPLVYCIAVNSIGAYGSCTTTVARHLQAAQSMAGDSWVGFAWDVHGKCTALNIGHQSYYQPK